MNRKLAIDILKEKDTVILKCNGNSMRPIMSPGNALHIKKVDHSLLRVGDAVFCKIQGNLQVHKISAITSDKRFQISNNSGHINGVIGPNNIFGLCVQVEDKVLVDLTERA